MVDIGSLRALLDHRRRVRPTSPPRGRREERASAARTIRELVACLEARSAEAADARARYELAKRAHSALREELEAERSKGLWRRLLGG